MTEPFAPEDRAGATTTVRAAKSRDSRGTRLAGPATAEASGGQAAGRKKLGRTTAAANYLGSKYLSECTLYVTLEPCIMCAGAAFWSQVGALVYGASDEKRGYLKISSAITHPKTIVKGGVMAEECGAILIDFFRKKRD